MISQNGSLPFIGSQPRLVVVLVASFSWIHRIGWDNLQENPIFDGKNHGFRFRFSRFSPTNQSIDGWEPPEGDHKKVTTSRFYELLQHEMGKVNRFFQLQLPTLLDAGTRTLMEGTGFNGDLMVIHQ